MRTIVKSRSLAFLAGAVVSATALVLGGAGDRVIIEPKGDLIDQEPVLMWDVAGYGLGGPIHDRLAVYSDGLVTYAAGGFEGTGSACFTFVSPEAAHQLAADLAKAGVFQAADEPLIAADVPLTTVTAFRPLGNGQSRATTFSFGVAFTPVSTQVTEIVQEFKASYLPEGGCNGSGG
jgi:hypothetical protein